MSYEGLNTIDEPSSPSVSYSTIPIDMEELNPSQNVEIIGLEGMEGDVGKGIGREVEELWNATFATLSSALDFKQVFPPFPNINFEIQIKNACLLMMIGKRKRGVNKKVLKVPSIEQKVLDATSNEPWGPHGSHLADIAQATRNYNEYQMIMAVIWKRINDTGKNWRHVYKKICSVSNGAFDPPGILVIGENRIGEGQERGLTVLEYLVAHGSERVIDEIREHSYQISILSEFQYVDSSGRDQGSNVRKKSQSLVALVNDKERIQEVREKAAANREKYRNTSTGSMYRPGSYSNPGGYGDRYDEDRYGGRG
nr:clathrin interactor EPSIN 3-like isoform X1 [Ipomoea batatas]